MRTQKAARDCGNNRRAKSSTVRDATIIANYQRGTRIAGWMFCAMFVVLTLGVVVFQW